jgi:alpha-beta hydrolase superfamily lysophospholipase
MNSKMALNRNAISAAVDPSVRMTYCEPAGIAARGTVIMVGGRGETPQVYERFGRRLAADAYRVHSLGDPTVDSEGALQQVRELVAGAEAPRPIVLIGSDAGASFVSGIAASRSVTGVDALILAGLPFVDRTVGDWEVELEMRTTCPSHRSRISEGAVRRGELEADLPDGWLEHANLGEIPQPILGVQGSDDLLGPLDLARAAYAAAPRAELVSVIGGRHDVLNDQSHRTVAAVVVLFLERLKLGVELPRVAVTESLGLD